MNFVENNFRNSFWQPANNVIEATAHFLCSKKPPKYIDNFQFYKDNYPIFWSEFQDYYHPEESRPSRNVFDISFPEPQKEIPKPFILPENEDPDENETGFSIEPGIYEPKDFWQGFTIEEPLELNDFCELVSQIANEVALENQEAATSTNRNNPTSNVAVSANQNAAQVAQENATEAQENIPTPDANGFYEGAKVYVSDLNRIWTRSGPGTQYRITDSKRIGDELTFISYSQDGNYVRLKDSDNKIVWMDLTTVQAQKCGYLLEEDLRSEIKDLQSKLNNYDSELAKELKQVKARLERVEKENAGMAQAIAQKDETIANLDEMRRDYADKLETKELDMQMRWWLQGAVIALAGAIVGIIFIYIPRPNRKVKRERY